MGTRYKHLSKDERDLLAVLKAKGCSMREIGETIGRDKATVFRELRRNAPAIYKGYYLSHKAQERAQPSELFKNPKNNSITSLSSEKHKRVLQNKFASRISEFALCFRPRCLQLGLRIL